VSNLGASGSCNGCGAGGPGCDGQDVGTVALVEATAVRGCILFGMSDERAPGTCCRTVARLCTSLVWSGICFPDGSHNYLRFN